MILADLIKIERKDFEFKKNYVESIDNYVTNIFSRQFILLSNHYYERVGNDKFLTLEIINPKNSKKIDKKFTYKIDYNIPLIDFTNSIYDSIREILPYFASVSSNGSPCIYQIMGESIKDNYLKLFCCEYEQIKQKEYSRKIIKFVHEGLDENFLNEWIALRKEIQLSIAKNHYKPFKLIENMEEMLNKNFIKEEK